MTRRRALALAGLLLAVALAALVVAGVTMLPEAARRLAIWRLEALTHRRVTIEGIDVNVFSGHVVVRGVRVAERDGPGMLAEVDRLEGRVHRRSLLRLHVWIEDLAVRGSRVRIVRLGPNRFNISDLLDRPATPSRVAITIDRLHIAQSAVVLEDRTLRPPRTWASERIVIEGRDISTVRGGGSAEAETILAGSPVSVKLEELRLVPVHLRAHVTVGNVDLSLLRLYIPGDAAVLPTAGTLAAGVTLVLDAHAGLRLSAGARIGNLELERRGQEGTFLTSPSLTVIVNDLALTDHAWSLARAEIDGDVAVMEAALAPPVRYDLRGTRLVVENVTWPATRPGRIAFAAGLPAGAAARVTGTVQAGPPRAELDVQLTRAPLELANRYLRLRGTLAGTADADAHVVVALGGATKITATGALALTRVSLADPDRPGIPPLAVERVDATGIEYAWPARATLALLHLRHPSAVLERGASGDLSLRALLARRAPAPAAGPSAEAGVASPPSPDVTVRELRVEDGSLTVTDSTLSPARRHDVTGVSLSARDAAWPARGPVQIALSATLPGGGTLALDGPVALDRRTADLRVALKNGDLALAQPYLPFAGRVRGRAEADVAVSAQLEPPRISVRGTVAVTDAAAADGDRPLLTLERVQLDGVDLAWPRRLEIQRIHVRRPWAAIERDARGQLSLRAIFSAPAGAGGARPGAPGPPAASRGAGPRAQPAMEIAVREALFEDGSSTILDTSVEPAARFHVEDSRLLVRNLTWPVKTPAQVELATGMPRGGRLQASGTFQIDPGRVDLRVALSAVNLAPAQPYLPVEAHVTGKVDGEAQLSATFDPLALDARGRATLTDLGLGDGNRSLFTAGRARVEDARVTWPGGVRIASVDVDRPWVLIERGQDGRFPLFALLTPHAPARAGAPQHGKDRPPSPARPRWEIATLSLTDAFGRYVDYGTTPDFAEELSAMQLTATGIDTAPGARTQLALRATLGPASPLTIKAELNLTGPRFYDVLLDVADYSAVRANPYLDLWTGWHARQGRLTTTLHYRIDGDELEASNDIGVKNLELAEAARTQEVKRRIGLPLDTLVSLLKDRHGDIHVSIPVHGLLSSPEFELREAIWGAARNLAIRLVALPFSLIGKLFFSEDSRIEAVGFDPVPFEPGTAALIPAASEQLGRLAAFLKETPAVSLRLRPVLTVADAEILKREAVRERLRTTAKGANPAAMQAAAAQAFARRYPARPLPPSLEEIVAVLAEAARVPDAALRSLATGRVTAALGRLTSAGVDAARLAAPERPPVVESEGSGRVEFELAP